jgi:hypothetical protein
MQITQKPLFRLGRLSVTPSFLDAVPRPAMVDAIRRYATGDFGEVSEADARINRWSVDNGRRVVARYRHAATRFVITTDPDRSVTRIYLPGEGGSAESTPAGEPRMAVAARFG